MAKGARFGYKGSGIAMHVCGCAINHIGYTKDGRSMPRSMSRSIFSGVVSDMLRKTCVVAVKIATCTKHLYLQCTFSFIHTHLVQTYVFTNSHHKVPHILTHKLTHELKHVFVQFLNSLGWQVWPDI